MNVRRLISGLAIALALATPAFAVQPSEILKDPALEARARTLSAELRCMVCQNQSIDDSDAALAADIRVLLRERIAAGDSDAAVVDFLVARYGEFILLKPRLNGHTALLWVAPPAVLILGLLVAGAAYWRRRQPAVARPFDPAEEATLRKLLAENPEKPANITES